MPHQRIQGHVVDVDHSSDDDDDDDDDRGYYKIHWCDHNNNNNNNDKNRKKTVFARHLVFACGMTGRMVVPPGLEGCPRFASWREPRAFPSKSITVAGGRKPVERVLVVGGGLTAVQTALRVRSLVLGTGLWALQRGSHQLVRSGAFARRGRSLLSGSSAPAADPVRARMRPEIDLMSVVDHGRCPK